MRLCPWVYVHTKKDANSLSLQGSPTSACRSVSAQLGMCKLLVQGPRKASLQVCLSVPGTEWLCYPQ